MIVTGNNKEKYLNILCNALQLLEKYGLSATLDKGFFMKDKVVYCRHEISANGLRKTQG